MYKKGSSAKEEENFNLRQLTIHIGIPLLIIGIFVFFFFWPFRVLGWAEGVDRWCDAKPLKYSGISWPARKQVNAQHKTDSGKKEPVHTICLNEATNIDAYRVMTCTFKLSAPKDDKHTRYYTYVDITSKFPEDWTIIRVFPEESNPEKVIITKIVNEEHWRVEAIPPGEHITFVCCWKNIGPIIPRIKCKSAVNICFRESGKE